MLVTSVCLAGEVAAEWRRHQRSIMKMAIRTLRVQMRKLGVRRGVKKRYNRPGTGMQIVTTRFTEAEYDTLHFVASSLRVSVSMLVTRMIEMWLKPPRRQHRNQFMTNYENFVCNWNENAGILTESLLFYPKMSGVWQRKRP